MAKKLFSLTMVLMLILSMGIMGAQATTTDTDFNFDFTGNSPQYTEARPKDNTSGCYIKSTTFGGPGGYFSVKVFGTDSKSVNGVDCTKGSYAVTRSQPIIQSIQNNVRDRYIYARIQATKSDNTIFGAVGVWSPDNSTGK